MTNVELFEILNCFLNSFRVNKWFQGQLINKILKKGCVNRLNLHHNFHIFMTLFQRNFNAILLF